MIVGLSLYGALVWILHRRFHKKLAAAFSRHGEEEPTFAAVKEKLDDLNEDSAHFVFTMDRRANIAFRGRSITLVYGRVGTRSPGGIRGPVWTLRKTIYVLVPRSESAWMESHSEVFQQAMSGYHVSIFWVNLEAMLRQ